MRISVITACYNSVSTVLDTLQSVASQTHSDIEHIIIDGGSIDGTMDILQSHRAQFAALVSEPDGGIYNALNKGILRATGDVVGVLHSDDLFANDTIVSRVATAFADPVVDAVYGDLDYVFRSDTSKVIRRWRAGHYSRGKLSQGWMPPHPTLFVRREIYARWGCFDIRYRIAADYDFLLRILDRADLRLVYIPEVLVKMRVGGKSNRSLSHILRKSYEDYLALRRNGVGGLVTLCWKNLSKLGQFF